MNFRRASKACKRLEARIKRADKLGLDLAGELRVARFADGSRVKKVENLIEIKLKSKVDLINKMSSHHFTSGGKRMRALLTLGSAKLAGYNLGSRDVNLASCVELIHSATLLHDDVIDESIIRRGLKNDFFFC